MFDPNDKKYDGRKELEEGRYIALVNLVFPKRSASGNDMVVFEFRIIGRHGKGGKSGFEYYLLTEEQMWKLAKLCRAIGVDKPFDPTSLKSLTKLLHNQIIVINVELRDDKDKDGAKVKRPRVVSTEAPTDADFDELNELYGDEDGYPTAEDNIPPKPKEDGGKGSQRNKPKNNNDDDDDQPRRRKPADDDDDDAPPARRKPKNEDDDDEAPAKPRPAHEPAKDDAEEKPRQRRAGRGVYDDDIPF